MNPPGSPEYFVKVSPQPVSPFYQGSSGVYSERQMRGYCPPSVSPTDQPLNPHWTGSSGTAQTYGQLGYVPGQGWGSRAEELGGEQEMNEMDSGRGYH